MSGLSWQSRSRKRARGEVTSRQAAPHADFADKSKKPFRTRAMREPDFCGSDSGGRKRSGSGGRGASRVAFGKRFGRFVPGEQWASRRLCRTLGLPDFGKSPSNRGVFRVTSRTVRLLPDPPGGRVRRRVVGGSVAAAFSRRPWPCGRCLRQPILAAALAARIPVARIENRSRVACPLPGPVVGRRGKSEKLKLAVSLEPRANRRTWARVKQIPPDKATPVPRGADAPLGLPQEPRRRRRHGSCFPRLVAVAPRPHARRAAPCFYSSPLDAARSKDGAGPRRLMLGTLAAR